MNTGEKVTILIIDDEKPITQRYATYLENFNDHTITVENGGAGLKIFQH